MCGINGILSREALFGDEDINTMNDRIVCRGPDSQGLFCTEHIKLGMRRLSIIDLIGGDQPIFNEDKRFVIVFNGEIYNFQSIMDRLKSKGHVFKSRSDTEVIVHLYEDLGEKCTEELNGMFSFAIFDTVKRTLFLARDKVGKKPLYYCIDHGRFIFASELKSILAVSPQKRQLSKEAIDLFLSLTFIPAPFTIYNDIYKLEGGCCLTVGLDLLPHLYRYWDLSAIVSKAEPVFDQKKCVQTIRDLLSDSVRLRMISDVPLGAFLSGGIDSSIIVAIMSELSSAPVKTFTIGNKIRSFDETDKARIVAKRYKTDHTEWFVDNEYLASILDKVIANFDEPFADSSALPCYVISELARKKVKVVLTGDGGDELFGGYSRYLVYAYLNLYHKIPLFIRKNIIRPFVNCIPSRTIDLPAMSKIIKMVNNMGTTPFDQYHHLQRLGFSDLQIKSITSLNAAGYTKEIVLNKYQMPARATDLQRAMMTDILIGLEGDMLAKVDRTSMMNSLEARCPFLDYRLIETSFSVPDRFKIKGFKLKNILKESFKDKIPEELRNKGKMGFAIPIGRFLGNEFRSNVSALLNDNDLRSLKILNFDYFSRLYSQHSDHHDVSGQLWPLYVFAHWLSANRDKIIVPSDALKENTFDV